MIYTVTFNPSLDYIVSVDNFTCGIVNRTTDEIIFPGGKGINVSMVLKNLGFENLTLGFLAGFTGNRIQDLLEEKGVRADFISVEKGISRINVKLRSNEETEINGQGPAIAEADIKKLYEKLDTLSDGDILVLAGSIGCYAGFDVYGYYETFTEQGLENCGRRNERSSGECVTVSSISDQAKQS